MEQFKYDVFISYSRKDYVDEQKNVIPGNVVSKIKDALTEAGISYWFDEEGIYSGDNFTEVIVRNIEDSQLFLYISTANANRSRWTSKEIATADELGKKIIPLRIDRSPYERSVIFRISNLSYIDYYQNPERGINDLVTSIKAYLAQIQEEADRKKAEEEQRRDAERKKVEEEKKRIEQEQQDLVSNIKKKVVVINNEETQLEINRNNLLLEVENVANKVLRETLKQSINAGGTIHQKYQNELALLIQQNRHYEKLIKELQHQIEQVKPTLLENASLIQQNQDYKKIIEELQCQIEQVKPTLHENDRTISQFEEDLVRANTRIKELETALSATATMQKSHEPTEIELKEWNWGAFFFSWIWGIHNKLYWRSLAILVLWIIEFLQCTAFILFEYNPTKWVRNNSFLKSMNNLNPWIIPILLLVVSLVLGLYGSRWAWQSKKWDSWEQFQIAKRRWNKAILWAIPIMIIMVIAGIAISNLA
ncbi:MAG: TIR domain-containing protein [Bacteroidales bacterium]|nr:TIR domain-containing protein [Bacteroidales bacterium]